MTLTANELLEYIKKHDITLVRTTERFKDIPAGTELWFGNYFSYVSTDNWITENRNKKFGYDFDYQWWDSWHDMYTGKFEIGGGE